MKLPKKKKETMQSLKCIVHNGIKTDWEIQRNIKLSVWVNAIDIPRAMKTIQKR